MTANLNVSEAGSRELARKNALRELRESGESIPACFERMAAMHSARAAIVSDGWQFSYSELTIAANRLAHAIIGCGGELGDRVAILMEHDAPAVVAVSAVLNAGRIVVALNRTHPVDRLRQLMEDCEPAAILTDANNLSLAASIAGSRVILRYEDAVAAGPDHSPSLVIPAGQTAVLGYTSGSTGRPKGVMMTHHMLRRGVAILTEAVDYCPEDRLSLFGSLGGAQGIINMWCALLNGATLCPFPLTVRGATGLSDWIARHRLTAYGSSASIFRNFIGTLDASHTFPGIRAVRLSSEPATSDDFRLFQQHFRDDCVFVHTLSSSETGNMAWSRRRKHDPVPEGRLPIGVPSDGQELLLLDDSGQPVARNAIGEIVVRSRYLSGGYWRDPELTEKRFSGVLDERGTRQFHTGDLGRINADGLLEFCGRRDDQVKIRGNRIAFGEIENALHKLPGVGRAVVEAVARPDHEPMLVGFLTLDGGQVWSSTELRRTLRAVLPDYMVPSEFVILETFPVTPSGKIDRQRLRQGHRSQRLQQPRQQPKTATESLLAAIWAQVFQIDDVGRDEDFFALGGDSLIAAVVAAEVHEATGAGLNLPLFAEHPTLAKLASVIDELRAEVAQDEPPLTPAPRTVPLPMSFTQERIWKYSRTVAQSAAYTMARIYRIAGPLDPEILRHCIDELSRRHEILHSIFMEKDGKPVQIAVPSMPTPPFQYIDMSGAQDPEAQTGAIFKQQAAYSFDLTREPLLRFCLVRLRENEHWLLRVSHHINADNASWVLYLNEMALLYQAKLRGEQPSWPKSSGLQYGDYAAWQRKSLDRDGLAYRQSVKWWKDNLSDAPRSLELPFARDRASHDRAKHDRSKHDRAKVDVRPADGMLSWGVERAVSHRLNDLSSSQSATHATVRLAVFAALLAAETGASDLIVGMYTLGRTRLQLMSVFGDFTNLVALRFRYDPFKSFLEWLAIVRDQVLHAAANSAIPFEELCEEMRQGGVLPPDIQVIFHVSLSRQMIEFAGLSLTTLSRARQSFPWGFTVDFDDQNENSACQMLFDPRIYDPVGVRVFVEQYKRLLTAVSLSPEKTLQSLLTSIAT